LKKLSIKTPSIITSSIKILNPKKLGIKTTSIITLSMITFSIMTVSPMSINIMTHSMMALNIKTHSIMTFSMVPVGILLYHSQHNDINHAQSKFDKLPQCTVHFYFYVKCR